MSDAPARILVVEDERIVAADLESTLRQLGYRVVGGAASGAEAIRKALDLRPDLVLMDIRLEGDMDGIAAAEVIRAERDMPIVYLTAYADDATLVRAKATTPFGYLIKPFNERELHGAIEIALYKHEADRRLLQQKVALAEAEGRRRTSAEAERRFRLLIEGVKDYAIYMLDPEGRVATWNAGAERIKGYPASEVLGRHFSMFCPPEDIARGVPERLLSNTLRDGRCEHEGFRVRKDGSRFWANVVYTTVYDEEGALHGFATVTRDLTDRRHAEETQRLLDELTLLLSSSLDAGWALQKAAERAVPELGDLVFVNLADDRGRLAVYADAHAPSDADTAAALSKALPRRESALYAFQNGADVLHEAIVDAGSAARLLGVGDPERLRAMVPISYICAPIELRGRRLGLVELVRRASRGRYRCADLEVVRELARRIGIALDNARLYEDAQEAIRARDEFLAIASHELRTPLTPLQLQLESLARALDRTDVRTGDLVKRIERCLRQTARLTRLVENLLDVSRITNGAISIDREDLDVCALVREVADRFASEAKAAGSAIRVSRCEPIAVRWDRMRMDQVVSNLVSNAVKYGAGQPIDLSVEPGDDTVRLTVKDHGVGIPPDGLPRIFERFERAASVRHYGGLGLGLFIVRQIVDAHGGTITAASELGQGSTFTVTLPYAPASPGASGAPLT